MAKLRVNVKVVLECRFLSYVLCGYAFGALCGTNVFLKLIFCTFLETTCF